MGLTILAFLAAPLLLLLAAYADRRAGAATGAAALTRRTVVAIDACLAASCLCQGLSFSLLPAGAGAAAWALRFDLLTGAFLFAAHAALAWFALSFPAPAPAPARAAGLVLALATVAFVDYRILATRDYTADVFLSTLGPARFDGPRFRLISAAMAAIGTAAAIGLATRAALSRDRISRQRAAVAAVGAALGPLLLWALSGAQAARSGVRSTYALMPLGSLVLGSILTYAYALSRIFDWRAIGRTLASYAILLAAAGLPTGLVAYLVGLLRRASPGLALAASILTFLVAYFGARRLSERLLEGVRSRGDYREELESALSHIDLAEGRDSVLGELEALLREYLGFAEFNVLIEDDRGLLRTVHSSSGARASIERGSTLSAALESAPAPVLFKSEALSDPAYAAARDELVALFDSLKAEALIVAREGRRAIGAFSLGPRLTGAEYTAYDHATLRSLYGKLFVFAYYLKNIARESLVHTVDRELALSDQVIHFALEKVDRVSHPGVDAGWSTRSTRRLGGDFVDFVRISKDRWFFVIGDVSGKGLSASMNMLILKSMIRTFLRVERGFAGLVARVNAFIKDNLPRGTFFAGAFGYFDFAEGSLYFINCGVPAMLLYSPALDTFVEVQGEGRVLGFVRDIGPHLKPRKVALPPGSVLAVATDGVTDSESIRGERFGKDRLRRSVRERLDAPSREIAEGALDDLLAFTDRKQEDDLTLLVLKIAPRSKE